MSRKGPDGIAPIVRTGVDSQYPEPEGSCLWLWKP
jgi:hypothetical protein